MSYESQTGAVIFAKNLDRMAAFYSLMLGFTDVSRDEDHIVLQSSGVQFVVQRIIDGGSAAGDASGPPTHRSTAVSKPVFLVPSISRLRGMAETHGAVLEPADREWSFGGFILCDGLDPDGNAIRFREPTRWRAARRLPL